MTHDWLALQRRVHDEFGRRVAAVGDWDARSPGSEWSVRDLVTHVVEEQQWVPHLLAGRTIEQARRDLEPLREDLAAEWSLYSFAATEAWASRRPDAVVRLARDTVSVDDYLREHVSDIAIHTWDLAHAIGGDEVLDPQLVQAVWSVFEPQAATLAASGLYALPKTEDVPLQHRLLAATGRDPRSGVTSMGCVARVA